MKIMNATKTSTLIESDLQYFATHFETKSIEEILADFPDLERDDILAVLAYAAHLVRLNRIELFTA